MASSRMAAASTNENNKMLNNDGTAKLKNEVLEPTYSTPRDAAIAYQNGLLKSDFNISSTHTSIRLAFRYLKQHEEEDDEQSREHDDETLFLCWIRQDGIPCHFRPMLPSTLPLASVATEENNNNLTNSTTYDTSLLLLVNENDHIETTFPGHAFVFCLRVKYNQHMLSKQNLPLMTTLHNNEEEEDDDDRSDPSEHTITNNESDPIVIEDNGKIYFIRKQCKCKNNNQKQDRENNDDSRGSEQQEEDVECYLVVGGFRPGPMPEINKDDDNSTSIDGSSRSSSNVGEGNMADDNDKSVDDYDDDDSFDGGREQQVQLVTIQKDITKKAAPATTINRSEGDTDDDNDDDIDLPSNILGCSDCTQSVPFLRGAMNPKMHHTPAFVATKVDDDDENVVSQVELPMNNHKHHIEEEHEFKVSVCITQLDPTPIDSSSKHYEEVTLGGWPCRIEPGCFPSDMDIPENGKNTLRCRFENDLLAASEALPPIAREKLKDSTPVWINKSQSYGPKVAPVRGRDGCFHPGEKWLIRNGMNPAKCGGVEWYDAKHYLSDCDLWGRGGLMLHELSHAWHCLHIQDGYDNKDIIDVYKKAMDDGLYDCVRVHGSQGPRCKAYACQDPMEYFAELSVAFLGGLDEEREHNKWYPFNRAQLREHDPRAFDLLCRMWGVKDESALSN